MTEFRQRTEVRQILVGWDCSPGAAAALQAAAAIADDGTTHVTVLAVIRPLQRAEEADDAAADYEAWRDHVRQTFDKASQALADTVRPRVDLRFAESTEVAHTVCDYARDQGFDLLALGRHGSGGLLHPRLGHVAATAARKSDLPVLLAP